MSLEYIRRAYGVPAKRGGKVEYLATNGELIDGTIVGADGQYLSVRLGDNKRAVPMHPTWHLKYLPEEAT